MKNARVLMFGWEFPPHISGGLGTACLGIAQGLAKNGVKVLFVMPKASGDEDGSVAKIINASDVEMLQNTEKIEDFWKHINFMEIGSNLVPYLDPETFARERDQYLKEGEHRQRISYHNKFQFSGKYGANLMEEVYRYALVAGTGAKLYEFDVIHAHDWLTYPAGIHAKQVSGKPLVVHVHATDFDRSRGNVNPTVYAIERDGMDHADCIMCVSELTRRTVIDHYGQDPAKVVAMHNAVYPLPDDIRQIVAQRRPASERKEKVVTFLGRITMQKGPEYFVEAAALVLKRTRNIRFCFAGSGDMMEAMINLAAQRGIADRFHFPGFMKGREVYEIFRDSDVYVMPSVSEPFGISPLEAMQCGVPSIISYQSGCAEILDKCIKTDYWDIEAMADAMYSICTNDGLFEYLQTEGKKEVDQITWEKVGLRIRRCYDEVLARYK